MLHLIFNQGGFQFIFFLIIYRTLQWHCIMILIPQRLVHLPVAYPVHVFMTRYKISTSQTCLCTREVNPASSFCLLIAHVHVYQQFRS